MNNNLNNLKGDLMNEKSMLNVNARKELIDYTIKATNKNLLKIFLIIFPITLIFIAAVFFFVFYFAKLIR